MGNEIDLVNKPTPQTTETPQKPRVSRNQFIRIKSPIHDYDQYSRVLGAFQVANMSPKPVVNNAIEKGHQIETLEIDAAIVAVGETGRGKIFKDENKTIYTYNEGEIEIVPQLVNPASSSVNTVIPTSNLETSTQPATVDFINTVGVYPEQNPQLPPNSPQPENNLMKYIRPLTDDDLKKAA